MNADKLVPEGVEGRVPYKGSAVPRHPAARWAACARAWATPAAHDRRDAHASRVRRDHLRRHARIARARRADHQGGAELPGRVGAMRRIARQDPDPRFRRAVHAADRAPRARGEASTARSIPATSTTPSSASSRRRASSSPAATSRPTRSRPRKRAEGGVRRSACRCSASATACRPWRSSSAAASRPGKVREFGYAEVRARGHTKLLDGIAGLAQRPKATACSTCG